MRLKGMFWGKQKSTRMNKPNPISELEEPKRGILLLDESEERCEELRKKVEKSLSILKVEMEINCTTDSFVIMENDVTLFPALIVNGRLLMQGKRVDVPELVQLLKNYL